MLARSSVIKQRVLALRILAAVLAAARPQASHQQAAGVMMPQPMNLPLHLSNNHNMMVSSAAMQVIERGSAALLYCVAHVCSACLHLHGSASACV
jgi:hypothetical protein